MIAYEQQEVSGFVSSLQRCQQVVRAFESDPKTKYKAWCTTRTTLYPGLSVKPQR